MIDKTFFLEYLNANSPTGTEISGQKIWIEFIKKYSDEILTDTYGTAVGIINPKNPYKVVIEAHADEISWFVNYISNDGYIYVIPNGGSDFQIAPSMRTKIHTEKEIIPAIFGWPAIHVRKSNKEFNPNIENITLDCGCKSKKEVEDLNIKIGDIVTFDQDILELKNGFIAGRALDNRVGGYMIAQVAKKIKENKKKIPFGLYIVNSVQEEIGLRGAQMIAHRIKPNLAIVTDVTHDTSSPLYNKKKEGDISCKKGPVIFKAPAIQNNVYKKIIDTAQTKKIQFQRAVAGRYTGTDTDAFAYSNEGVASALISLPLKYMHTTVETVHKDDIENTINLIYEVITSLKGNEDFSYF